jgi:hypothetical protein
MVAVSLDIKRLGLETDLLPTSRAKIKNAWSYTFILPYSTMAWCLIKRRDYNVLVASIKSRF